MDHSAKDSPWDFRLSVGNDASGIPVIDTTLKYHYKPWVFTGLRFRTLTSLERVEEVSAVDDTRTTGWEFDLDGLGWDPKVKLGGIILSLGVPWRHTTELEMGYVQSFGSYSFFSSKVLADSLGLYAFGGTSLTWGPLSTEIAVRYTPWAHLWFSQDLTVSPGAGTRSAELSGDDTNVFEVSAEFGIELGFLTATATAIWVEYSEAATVMTVAGTSEVESLRDELRLRVSGGLPSLSVRGVSPTLFFEWHPRWTRLPGSAILVCRPGDSLA